MNAFIQRQIANYHDDVENAFGFFAALPDIRATAFNRLSIIPKAHKFQTIICLILMTLGSLNAVTYYYWGGLNQLLNTVWYLFFVGFYQIFTGGMTASNFAKRYLWVLYAGEVVSFKSNPTFTVENYRELIGWCYENFNDYDWNIYDPGKDWQIYLTQDDPTWSARYPTLVFRKPVDAVRYKLTWAP